MIHDPETQYDADPDWVRVGEAADRAGASHRQLDHWITHGYLTCHRTGHGQGYPRYFTLAEAEVLKYMTLLVRHGVLPKNAGDLAHQLQATGRARLGLFVITTAHFAEHPDLQQHTTTSTGATA
ncbi:MerR family transcriptional regulator [Nocardioides lijunqiniae]|uniref:MerR family transcriptional regulator n=1 Tax=Nocardioides lijunqiniae TaxID=2760832 RepID=UPI0018776762